MELQKANILRARADSIKLWEEFLAKLQDQVLIVLSTKEVEPETEVALRNIERAIGRTHRLLLDLLGKDSRKIFFEREYVICGEIFKLLRNYRESYQDRLSSLAFQLRDLTKHRGRLQA